MAIRAVFPGAAGGRPGPLALRLVGQVHARSTGFSNRSAVGARVSVYAPGFLGDPAHRLGHQQAEAKSGFSARNPLTPTFGVCDALADVRIAWPGSAGQSFVQDIRGLTTGQVHVIVETRPGDVNGDGALNVEDLVAVIVGWGGCPVPPGSCPADLDGSGDVGVVDLTTVILNWSP